MAAGSFCLLSRLSSLGQADHARLHGFGAPPPFADTAVVAAFPLDRRVETAGDINADGWPDLVLRQPTTGLVTVWYVVNTAKVGEGSLWPVPGVKWRIAEVTDFNGDAWVDLVWRHYETGMNTTWHMAGMTMLDYIYAPDAVPIEWAIGAGDLDVLKQAPGNGVGSLASPVALSWTGVPGISRPTRSASTRRPTTRVTRAGRMSARRSPPRRRWRLARTTGPSTAAKGPCSGPA